jgi:hypothetical protein
MLLYGLCKELLSGCNIPVFGEQEIDCQAMFVDCSVEISPPASDSDVRLVHPPRSADWSSISLPALLELWDITLDPSQDCSMRESDTALGHHLYQVVVAKFVGNVPSNTEDDDRAIEVAATEERW